MNKINFQIRLPDDIQGLNLAENEEYFFIIQNAQERRLRLHDYAEVYSIPGLYEYILLEKLGYRSYEVMPALLVEKVTETGLVVEQLKILEIGAGSGLFGKALAKRGVASIIGVDKLQEAAVAANREAPGIYQEYIVEDLTKLSQSTQNKLEQLKLNCLVCCSALSKGHIPAAVFKAALNVIQKGGWVMFNISKTSYDNQINPSEFICFYREEISQGNLELYHTHVYEHRRFFNGQTLQHIAVLARKQK